MSCTPLRSSSVPVKRGRFDASPVQQFDSVERLCALTDGESLPGYMKQLMEIVLDMRKEINSMSNRLAEVVKENNQLREENLSQKRTMESLLSNNCSQAEIRSAKEVNSPEVDFEMKRSLVVIGVPESNSPSSVQRAHHDYNCMLSLLDFLGIECLPTTVYRMGRSHPQKPRLVKVVLPASKFQVDAVSRAPRLRYFSHKGVFIRPSLPREERVRMREECLAKKVESGGLTTPAPPLIHASQVSDVHSVSSMPLMSENT